MREPISPLWLIVLVIVIAASVLAQCDCTKGVLVRTASGSYACVQEVGR
jgi:hypothetical protein